MSSLSDAFKAIQQVMLMQSRIEQLEHSNTRVGQDVKGIARAVDHLGERVARIEGFIDGVATASRPKRLPKRSE